MSEVKLKLVIVVVSLFGLFWISQSQTPSEGIGRGAGGGVSSITAAGIKSGNWCLAASGSGTTYTCSTTNTSVLAVGQVYLFGIDTANSGNATLNINGTGAKAILHKNLDQFAAGDLVAGDSIELLYDGTQYVPNRETVSNNPGLDIYACGTAPGTPSAGFVSLYCTAKVPYFKNEDGTVYGPGLVPPNSKSADYTTVLLDTGKAIVHPGTDNNARTFTIAANASVAYPLGGCMTFINKINTVTISITSDTLTFAGDGSTGNRSLAANGWATACKVNTTEWFISGPGLT